MADGPYGGVSACGHQRCVRNSPGTPPKSARPRCRPLSWVGRHDCRLTGIGNADVIEPAGLGCASTSLIRSRCSNWSRATLGPPKPMRKAAALRSLWAAGLGPDKGVLATGASDGVGRFAIQWVARAGVHVIASVGQQLLRPGRQHADGRAERLSAAPPGAGPHTGADRLRAA